MELTRSWSAADWLQRSHTFEGVEGLDLKAVARHTYARFNGATPLRVWKVPVSNAVLARLPLLQRSHTFEGVEGGEPLGQIALMGLLQRSHTFEGVEGPQENERRHGSSSLQRSHTFEGVEGEVMARVVASDGVCFNGATPLRVWKEKRA